MSELEKLKQERADILRAFSLHQITSKEAIKRKNELDEKILKAKRKEKNENHKTIV